MLTNKDIKYLGYCRHCLSKATGIRLKRKDVIIYRFPKECARCKEVHFIVHSISGSKKWRLLFHRLH